MKGNIKNLEGYSKILGQKIEELKELFEKISENKENIKTEIQKTFTNIRNAINDREDQLLQDIDKLFDNIFFNEKIIK